MAKPILLTIAAVLTVLAWAPALAVFVTYAVADAAGCRVDEGSVHPCVIAGTDVGGLLYSLGVSGWLFLGTWPVALVGLLFWLGYGIWAIVRRVRGR